MLFKVVVLKQAWASESPGGLVKAQIGDTPVFLIQ